jgi:hypothetical protein
MRWTGMRRMTDPANLRRCGLAVALAAFWATAPARDIHYGAVTDPDLLACDERHWRGAVDAARSCYQALLADPAPLLVRAEAAWALGDLKTANDLFQAAVGRAVRPDLPVPGCLEAVLRGPGARPG